MCFIYSAGEREREREEHQDRQRCRRRHEGSQPRKPSACYLPVLQADLADQTAAPRSTFNRDKTGVLTVLLSAHLLESDEAQELMAEPHWYTHSLTLAAKAWESASLPLTGLVSSSALTV